jgi:Fe-S-cluster-containing dehydrogenase component
MKELPWEAVGSREAPQRRRAGMVVDLRRCIGCHACSVSCKTEHLVPLGGFRTRVRYLERPGQAQLFFLPLLCMHCQDAPCMTACPTEALSRGEDGRVVLDKDLCCGNKACIAACPYGAIYIDPQEQVADKCDLCSQRTSVGLDPACVAVCPTEALRFGDLDDPEDAVARYAREHGAKPFKEEAGTEPSVLFVALEEWVEQTAATGVQPTPDERELVYDQGKGEAGR